MGTLEESIVRSAEAKEFMIDIARVQAAAAQIEHLLGIKKELVLAVCYAAARTAEAERATNHWFTEANRDHNDLVRARTTLEGMNKLVLAGYEIHFVLHRGYFYRGPDAKPNGLWFPTLTAAIQAAVEELDR